MFTIILAVENNKILESISRPKNQEYLIQNSEEYPILKELCIDDYDVFNEQDADQLIFELTKIKKNVGDIKDLKHVDEIIRLVEKCRFIKGSVIVFNPLKASLLEE